MSRPPSYRIIRRAYADGSEKFSVSTARNIFGRPCGWLSRWPAGFPMGLSDYTVVNQYDTRQEAEAACHKHWQQWLSEHQLFTEEIHFDPEAPCTQ